MTSRWEREQMSDHRFLVLFMTIMVIAILAMVIFVSWYGRTIVNAAFG